MVRGFSCTCNKQEGKRFQITSVTVLLSLSNIPAICHSFPYPQKPLHTTPSIGHHMSSYCYGYTQGNARIHETWPDGDNYADGHPEESIRMMVHDEAMADLRALELLESLTSKAHVMELIEGELFEPLTFCTYPKSEMYLITLRNRINREIGRYQSEGCVRK